MTPLAVIRPEPGCAATVATAQAAGMAVHGYPLFRIVALPWEAPVPDSFDALLLGSANALRLGGEALSAYAGKPAYAVGETTAEAARAAGFAIAGIGTGGLQAMLGQIDRTHTRLLRLAGRDRVSLDPPPHLRIAERVVYASDPLPMPPGFVRLLQESAVVALHSAEAASHFAAECDARGLDRSRIRLAALGPRIAAAAGAGWAACASAAAPTDKALLALAAQMCEG
jgi:uroporphyrinogen-III synthase